MKIPENALDYLHGYSPTHLVISWRTYTHPSREMDEWCKHERLYLLSHWGRVTHICVGKLTIIVSDNGLSPDRRQAIIWTNAGILLIRHLGTNFCEILIEIHKFSLKKMYLKMSSAKFRSFCLSLILLSQVPISQTFHGIIIEMSQKSLCSDFDLDDHKRSQFCTCRTEAWSGSYFSCKNHMYLYRNLIMSLL